MIVGTRLIFAFSIVIFKILCQSIDSPCTLESSASPGKCKLISDCKHARDQLIIDHRLPQTCGFQDTQSIVCCPLISGTTVLNGTDKTKPVTNVTSGPEVADGFSCPPPCKLPNRRGSFCRYAHADDCRQYYICLERVHREYSCPIGTVFRIGDSDGTGNCEDPTDVPGCEDYYGDLDPKTLRKG